MKKAKFTFSIAALVSFVLPLCACAKSVGGMVLIDDYNDGYTGKEISFFGYTAEAENLFAVEEALHGFMKANEGLNVIYEGVSGAEYWTALKKRAEANVLDEVFMVDRDHIADLVNGGIAEDVKDILDVEAYGDIARSQILRKGADGAGQVYFAPMCLSTFGLYVNYSLLSSHGIKIPENFGELQNACDYFVSKGVTPIVVNNSSCVKSLIIARGMYGVYNNAETEKTINLFNSDSSALAAKLEGGINMVAQMVADGWIDGVQANKAEQASGALDVFAKGDSPFMIAEGSATVKLKKLNGQLKYGVHPYPVADDGSVLVVDADVCVSVNAESEDKDDGMKFFKYLTKPDIIRSYCESRCVFSPLKDFGAQTDKTVAPCVEYLTNGRSVIGSDYNITVPLDGYLLSCADMLMDGAGAAEVNAYISAQLKVKGGAMI